MNLMYKSKNKLPTEKMIIDLLNGEDISEEILSLYHNYIVAASTMTINNVVYYNCIGSIEIPDELPINAPEIVLQTRKGVSVSYQPNALAKAL